MEYIEERWPEPRLLPKDPAKRAFALITEDVCDTHYEAVNWGFGEILWYKRAAGALAEKMKAEAVRQTAVLQAWLTERLGRSQWFGGEAFGWADAAVAPMVNRSVHYGMGPAAGSPLAAWHARLRQRPSVAATFAEFDAVAPRMSDMAAAYASGERRREYRDHRLEWMVKSGGIDVVVAGLRNNTIRFPWPDPA
jgi:RNA polymerase-associated protein